MYLAHNVKTILPVLKKPISD